MEDNCPLTSSYLAQVVSLLSKLIKVFRPFLTILYLKEKKMKKKTTKICVCLTLLLSLALAIDKPSNNYCRSNDEKCKTAGDSQDFLKRNDDPVNNKSGASTWLSETLKWAQGVATELFSKLVGVPDAASKYDPYAEESLSFEEMMQAAKQMAAGLAEDGSIDMEVLERVIAEAANDGGDTEKIEGEDVYEYQPVYRMDPGKVGDIRYVELEDGVKTKVITLAVNPPLFEIPDFVSDEECDYIIEKSKIKGLKRSTLFKKKTEVEAGTDVGIERISYSSFLRLNDTGKDFMNKLHTKVSRLIGMPVEVVQKSENLAIGMYKPGGHYYAHLDSNEAAHNVPCCFQKDCKEITEKVDTLDCCRLCRYMTVLYYLNDVEEGGETAFPFADLSIQEMMAKDKTTWENLTATCHESSVVIKPKKGKAIMWYNHFVDRRGFLSNVDKRSYHGGCDVIKGEKWIATNWISAPVYSRRFVPSKYTDFNEEKH